MSLPNFVMKYLSYYCLHYITKNIAFHIAEVLIFCADKLMAILKICVFNFAILLKLRKFNAHEIYMFYSSLRVFACEFE